MTPGNFLHWWGTDLTAIPPDPQLAALVSTRKSHVPRLKDQKGVVLASALARPGCSFHLGRGH
jgi:hypothetical protein